MHRLLVLCAFALPAVAGDYTERKEFTYPLAENGRFYLKSEVGEITLRASDRKDVHIVAVKRARDSDEHNGPGRLAGLRLAVDASPSEVRVRAVWPQASVTRLFRGKTRLQVDYEIEAPRTARLYIDNGIGEVRIRGAANDVIVRSNIGEVSVDLAGAFQPRRVYLQTKIGEVDTGLPGLRRGWLGKKFTTLLPGAHTLDVRVGIGEIRISGGKARKLTEL